MRDAHANTHAIIRVSNPPAAIDVDIEVIRTCQVGEEMFLPNSYVSTNYTCFMENPSDILLIPGPDCPFHNSGFTVGLNFAD